MNLSIVIPLYNEEESLKELHSWIERVMIENGFTYEIIFVDDGSNDSSWPIIEELAGVNPSVKGIKFRRNYGKAAALRNRYGGPADRENEPHHTLLPGNEVHIT